MSDSTDAVSAAAVGEESQPVFEKVIPQHNFAGIDLTKYAIMTTKVYDNSRVTFFSTKNQTDAYLLVEHPEGLGMDKIEAAAVMASLKLSEEAKADIQKYLSAGGKFEGKQGALNICHGRAPKHGVNSVVEWHVRQPGDFGAGKENEQGQVDYRERQTFVFVEKGTHILTVHPPTKGEAGVDIRGKVLPAEDGQWIRPLAGENIKCDKDQRDMYAGVEGVVKFDGQRVSMARMLEVLNVDFKSGNIVFEGEVQVQGDVNSGFSVESTSDKVTVGGDVDNAKVFGQQVIVAGTVRGSEIRSESDARFQVIESTKVGCDGDIEVKKSAVNLTADCGGRLRMINAKLVGGNINALGGVECSYLGGKDGAGTSVKFIPEECRIPALSELRNQLDAAQTGLEKIITHVGPIRNAGAAAIKSLPPQKQEAIQKLIKKIDDLEFQVDVLKSQLKKAAEPFKASMRATIFSNNGIAEGVRVRIGEVDWVCPETKSGPHKISLNRDGTEIVCESAEKVSPSSE